MGGTAASGARCKRSPLEVMARLFRKSTPTSPMSRFTEAFDRDIEAIERAKSLVAEEGGSRLLWECARYAVAKRRSDLKTNLDRFMTGGKRSSDKFIYTLVHYTPLVIRAMADADEILEGIREKTGRETTTPSGVNLAEEGAPPTSASAEGGDGA